MALAHIVVGVSFQDDIPVSASSTYYGVLEDTTTLAAMLTDINSLITKIKAVSTAKILGFSAGVIGDVTDSLGTAPECERGVLFSFDTGTTVDWQSWIPSLDRTLVVGGKVNAAAGAIGDYAGELVAGSGAITWETQQRAGLTNWEDVAESFRKLRRQALKKTKAPAV